MANGQQMAPIDSEQDFTLKYNSSGRAGRSQSFTIEDGKELLEANGFFNRQDLKNYVFDRYARHGYMNVYNQDTMSKEVLFFTKPDLNIFDTNNKAQTDCTLSNMNSELAKLPFFQDAYIRHPRSLFQLQSSIKDVDDQYNPFMYLLSNTVASKLDLPGISADSQTSTENLFATKISYRTHSFKSDQDYDFTLTFKDTATLDLYWLVKIYDEYMRHLRFGEIAPKEDYIKNHVLSEQFSVYKFILSDDGETILYWAKLTGVYFTDVPRGDFGDPSTPFSYSLSFHAQFVEDNDPALLSDFNIVARTTGKSYHNKFVDVYNSDLNVVDNTLVKRPCVVRYYDERAERFGTGNPNITDGGAYMVYRLKWVS